MTNETMRTGELTEVELAVVSGGNRPDDKGRGCTEHDLPSDFQLPRPQPKPQPKKPML